MNTIFKMENEKFKMAVGHNHRDIVEQTYVVRKILKVVPQKYYIYTVLYSVFVNTIYLIMKKRCF